MISVSFHCPFEARGKGRPRVYRGRGITDPKTRAFEQAVHAAARMEHTGPAMTGPLRLDVFCTFAMPASWSKKKRAAMIGRLHTQKPDADNIIKSIADALNGVLCEDDKQFAVMRIEKRWADRSAFGVTVEQIL